jgi:hypothetical protein
MPIDGCCVRLRPFGLPLRNGWWRFGAVGIVTAAITAQDAVTYWVVLLASMTSSVVYGLLPSKPRVAHRRRAFNATRRFDRFRYIAIGVMSVCIVVSARHALPRWMIVAAIAATVGVWSLLPNPPGDEGQGS